VGGFNLLIKLTYTYEMGETCSAYREGKCVCEIFVGNPELKRPLGRLRCRWEDKIKADLQELGCGRMDWIELARNRESLAGTCEYGEFLD
jgi:hypothetical protein